MYRLPEERRLVRGHRAGLDIRCETDARRGTLANSEDRCAYDRRKQALESLAGQRELGRKNGLAGVDFGADLCGDDAHDPLGIVS